MATNNPTALNSNTTNIAASWPVIVNEHALNEASILPHLLHEASEEAAAAQQQIVSEQRQQQQHNNGNDESNNNNDDEQLQNMIENYRKHVIKQKQHEQPRKNTAGRSASHLQKKINAPQQTPMSHSQPCLFSDGVTEQDSIGETKNAFITQRPISPTSANLHSQHHSDPREMQQSTTQIMPLDVKTSNNSNQYRDMNGNGEELQQNLLNENFRLKQEIETLRPNCDRLEKLELSYRKIECDYEQMQAHHERRDELNRVAIQKLEQQLRIAGTEMDQLRAQNAKLNAIFGQQCGGNSSAEGGQSPQQIHFLLNELIPKNNELLMVQERQRMELEAQSATLEEQRTHIEVLEKALANAQERLAAKDRLAVDAVAVVDKCTHLQRMLQEALEDKQRQKEQHGRQVAQLEMELTQLRLQQAKENNNQALGSLGRKGGTIATTAPNGSPEIAASAEEILKLRKTLTQKEERISQLENSLLRIQKRTDDKSNQFRVGDSDARDGLFETRNGVDTTESLLIRLEMEKTEKERRIQELLDEKMRFQMQWAEERRSLDVRLRLLEKDLRHFMGSQSSLASSSAGVPFNNAFAGINGPYGTNEMSSPFASIREQKNFPVYLRHRSTAELPTSAHGAALFDERMTTSGTGRMPTTEDEHVNLTLEKLRKDIQLRKAKATSTSLMTTSMQRPSTLGFQTQDSKFVQAPASDADETTAGNDQQQQQPQYRSTSFEQSQQQAGQNVDMSPGSEGHQQQHTNGGGEFQWLNRQSAPSSASSKKRFMVNAPACQLNAYLEQLPEATRRRLTGGVDRISGLHLLPTGAIDKNAGAGMPPASGGRREGGCRRLIRDHSVDARKNASVAVTQAATATTPTSGECIVQTMPSTPTMILPPPNYQEMSQQQRQREMAPPPPPAYHPIQTQQSLRQLHQMSSIEEPPQEPPHPPPSYQQLQQQQQQQQNQKSGGTNVNIIEVKSNGAQCQEQQQQQQGDSDTLNGHKQLVFRRNSAGNNLTTAK